MDIEAMGLANRNAKFSQGDGYNLIEGLRVFRNAVADVDANPVKIACVGDSVTFGTCSSDIQNTSWVNRLRKSLQSKLGDVGVGTYPIPYSLSQLSATAFWTLAGTWTINSGTNSGVFARWMQATGTSATATLTFTGTSIDLIYAKTGSGASSGVSITIDSVAQTAPNFNGSGFGNVQTYSGLSAGSHTLVITAPASGNIFLEGVIAYNPIGSGSKGCYVFNAGSPSVQATYFTSASVINNVFKAHLYIIALGINDSRNGQSVYNSYYSTMASLINGLQGAGASVLLLPYYMINDTAQNNANYVNIVQQQYQLADQYNCGLIDIYSRWGKSYSLAQTAGLMGAGAFTGASGSDQWHPSDKGHREIANAIARHLIGQVS